MAGAADIVPTPAVISADLSLYSKIAKPWQQPNINRQRKTCT